MGKYEKLTALKMWEERTAKREEAERANSNTPDFRKLYANPDAPHYYHDCRPSTPEEKAEVHRKAEARLVRSKGSAQGGMLDE